jgi:hypothetical protein
LIKTDPLGAQQWAKYYGGTDNDGAYSLGLLVEGGYVLAGYTFNFGAVLDNAMIIKTDSAGNQIWLKTYGGTGNDRALSVKACADFGYCIAGYTNSYGAGDFDMYMIKTDSAGTQSFDETYGGALLEKGFSIDLAPDKGYILTGQTSSFGAGIDDLYAVKTDSLGVMEWQNFFGGSQNDVGFTIRTTKDLGYIAIGNTNSLNANSDIFVVKMDSTGYALSIQTVDDHPNTFKLYPNPASTKVYLTYTDWQAGAYLRISDLRGRIFLQKEIRQQSTEIDLREFAKGVYFITLSNDDGICTEKLVIQ